MFNPKNPTQLAKLRGAITSSLDEMKEFLTKRMDVYKMFVGKHYKNGTTNRVPLPLLALSVSTILRKLVSSEPQALVTSRKTEYRASAYAFELGINRLLRDMDMGRSMQTWAFEAMMCPMGILKVALDVEEVQNLDGMDMWLGKPMAEPVLFDDWVHDMSARRVDKIGFCGNRYSVVKEQAMTGGLYDPDVVERIYSAEKIDDYSSQNLSKEKKQSFEDYREMIELWDIWLPDEGIIVTLSRDFSDLPPLRVVDWSGPKSGPFHFLWFDEVPGNTMPLPPVALWRDIHELANILFNKLARQATRQKNLVTIDSASVQDGKLQVAGADGEALISNNPEGVREVRLGGIDQSNFGFVLQLKQLHNYFSGNTEALAGLAPQSSTLGQDELLSAAASDRVQSMQDSVDKTTSEVMRAISQILLRNPIADLPIVKRVGEMEIPGRWNPADLEGDQEDYELDMVPHSMRRKPPGERLAIANQFMQTLLQAMPAMQASGIMPNMEAFVKLTARLTNMPELNDLVIYGQGEKLPNEDQFSQPKTTTRQYVRKSQSTKTPQGQEQQLISSLMGGGNTGGSNG